MVFFFFRAESRFLGLRLPKSAGSRIVAKQKEGDQFVFHTDLPLYYFSKNSFTNFSTSLFIFTKPILLTKFRRSGII